MTLAQMKTEQEPRIDTVSENYARGAAIPWHLKMAVKIGLASTPLSYRLLSALGIFRHGDVTAKPANLYTSFKEFLDAYKARRHKTPENMLELGPGDSVGHALCAVGAGVKNTWLIDAGDFASTDESHYRALYADLIKAPGYSFDAAPDAFDRDSILRFSGAQYLTAGLASMKEIPGNTLDFSFSQAVFEHIRRDEFQPCMNELFRTHRPGSISRHWVDLHDHLGGALNNMRFAPGFWESGPVRRAGFYTNRLTMKEMADMAARAGFRVSIEHIVKWPALPTPRTAMHADFRAKDESELNVCTFLIVMEKP